MATNLANALLDKVNEIAIEEGEELKSAKDDEKP